MTASQNNFTHRSDCRALSPDQLRSILAAEGYPVYRAAQLLTWLDSDVTEFNLMTNLPEKMRAFLNQRFTLPSVKMLKKSVSSLSGDETVKYLFGLNDGQAVESVLMHYKHGWSQCLSTQAGCKMGCAFCATGQDGYFRNLSPSEMLCQIHTSQKDSNVRVSSIVLMGMGEPLDNFENVERFLEILAAPGGVNIGMRHVSLSTCGLTDGIRRLMERKWQLTLSVSLHAPNDEIRAQIMPVAKRWCLQGLLNACRDYAGQTGRRISFEYAMIHGVNDSDSCADELAQRLRGILCHVNLIPLNPVEGCGFKCSTPERIDRFTNALRRRGVNVTVRRTLGADIDASCGQLKRHTKL